MTASEDPLARAAFEVLGDLAVAATLADLSRTSSFHVHESAADMRERWIEYGLQWDFREYRAADPVSTPSGAIAHFADHFQEENDQTSLRCWPVCERHDVGLHPEVQDHLAVWVCRFGKHTVSPIGELGA
jgi:hypothetical protein